MACGHAAVPHLFPESEGDVSVLDHVHDLAFHGHEEEHKPVEQQNGPEHRYVEEPVDGRGMGDQETAAGTHT